MMPILNSVDLDKSIFVGYFLCEYLVDSNAIL